VADTAGLWSAAGVTLPWALGALGTIGACVLTWQIGRQAVGGTAGLLAALGLACYGPLYYYQAVLPGTGLLLCLLLGGLAAALHAARQYRLPWWAAAGGLLAGAGLLYPCCHAAVAALALWIPLAEAGGRRRRRNALLLLLAGWAVVAGTGAIVPGGPWLLNPSGALTAGARGGGCEGWAAQLPLLGRILRPGHLAVPAALGLLSELQFRRRLTLLLALPTAACAAAGLPAGVEFLAGMGLAESNLSAATATDLPWLLAAPMVIVWAAAGALTLTPSPRRPWPRAAVAWGIVMLLSWALGRLELIN